MLAQPPYLPLSSSNFALAPGPPIANAAPSIEALKQYMVGNDGKLEVIPWRGGDGTPITVRLTLS
jgi:hypothetical protein